jgi:hypothetical protein
MRRWVQNILFSVLLPLAVVTILVAVVSGTLSLTLRPRFLTDTITQHRVYVGFTDTFPALLQATLRGDPKTTEQLALALREQITPQVFRGIVEQYFQDAERWIQGDTDVLPRLGGTPTSPPKSGAGAAESAPLLPASPAATPTDGAGNVAQYVRLSIRAVRLVAPLAVLVTIIELLGIFSTGHTLPSRLKRIAVAMLIPGIAGVLFASFLTVLPRFLLQFGAGFEGLTAALFSIAHVLLSAVVVEIASRMLVVFFALTPLCIAIFMLARVIEKRQRVASALPAAPPL